MAEMTQARAMELFNYDPATGTLLWRRRPESEFATTRAARCWNSRLAGTKAGHTDDRGYTRVNVDGRMYLKHRLAWLISFGHWPKIIDHINGDQADDCLVNLRNVSIAENQRNLTVSRANKSGCVGVFFDEKKERWTAFIGVSGDEFYIGSFDTQYDAILARQACERLLDYHPNHGKLRREAA